MKAAQVAILLLCVNAGFFLVSTTGLWDAAEVNEGAAPGELSENITLENTPANSLPGPLESFVGSNLSIGIILAGILAGAASTMIARVTTPQAVGILAFVIIFSFLLGHLGGILQTMMVPTAIITIVTGFNYFWMIAAIIQMATGTSWRHLQ